MSKITDVGNDEILIRVIFAPEHVENGSIKPSAISTQDIGERGFSVDRKRYIQKECIESKVKKYLERNNARSFHGLALMQYDDVLSIRGTDEQPVLYVKSDPLPDNQAHALICSINKHPRSYLQKIRQELIKKFRVVETIDEALN